MKCAHFEKCFLFKARREAAQADVIVVNHHLLLSDLAVRRAGAELGRRGRAARVHRLVVDEGHHLEDAAAAHLGSTVTRRALQRLFNRLDRRGKGLLPLLAMRLSASKDLLSTASLDLVEARLAPAVHALREKSALLFDLLDTFIQESGEPVVRLTDDFATHPIWKAGLSRRARGHARRDRAAAGGAAARSRAHRGEHEARRGARAAAQRDARGHAPAAGGGRRTAPRARAAAGRRQRAMDRGARSRARRWSSRPCRSISRRSCARICSSGSTSAIVTSATLTASSGDAADDAHRFDFLASRLGLDDPELEPTTAMFPSPFRYASQSLLAIPSDVPAPNVDADGHRRAVTRIVLDVAEASDGGLFVLFTSHREVRQLATELRARGIERRWPLLVHGDETPRRAPRALSRRGQGDPARHGVVLGGRRRSRRRAARAGDREAAVPRADASRSRPRSARRSRRAAAIRSPSTCCRTRRCG